ncbi:MAG: glycosyltransferase family 4 protein [Acidimicrobiia bacterium]
MRLAPEAATPRLPPVMLTGTDRFRDVLDSTQAKKFEGMGALATHYVVAFSENRRFRVLRGGVHLYLLPNLKMHRFRQLMFLVAIFLLTLYLALFKRVRIAISQGIYDAVPLVAARWILGMFGFRTTVVVQVHGDWEAAAYLLGKLPRSSSPVVSRIARFVLRRADVVRAVSQYTLDLASPHMNEKTPRVVFPAFTDVELFLTAQESFPERSRLLYAGVLTPLKGVDVLIEAMQELLGRNNEIEMAVAGRGPHEAALRKQVAQLGLTANVTFLGFLNHEMLQQEISKAVCLVLPSLSEGFPLIIIEAMACGRPVVASRVGGIPELVKEGVTGLLAVPGDSHDLAEKIKMLVDDRGAASEMGRAARLFVKSSFSSRRFFDGYAELLRLASAQRDASAGSDH